MPGFITKKVFDCQDMPKELRKTFFELFEKGNDTYVDYTVAGEVFFTEDEWSRTHQQIDAWLIENGAGAGSENLAGEDVLIKHWW